MSDQAPGRMEKEGLRLHLMAPDRSAVDVKGVTMVVAQGALGELGIMPDHVGLVTSLEPGIIRVKTGEGDEQEEICYVVHGGFLEVRDNVVNVMADASERLDEIDVARAEAAKRRAEERLASRAAGVDEARARAALARAVQRLEAAGTSRGD